MSGGASAFGQLPLGVTLDDSAAFENFWQGPNGPAMHALEHLADGAQGGTCFLCGGPAVGKSHLLQSVCRRLSEHGRASAYLPLNQLGERDSSMLDGLESRAAVCVDDVDRIAGHGDWERALFRLYNALQEGDGVMVLAARQSPAGLALRLADLASRLAWGPVFRLAELDDAGKRRALQFRAARRGLELPEESARYLLNHRRRSLRDLFQLLDGLDLASLAAQRRLTVPFLRQTLF